MVEGRDKDFPAKLGTFVNFPFESRKADADMAN